MNADGSDVKQITKLKTVSAYPSFSPDGKRICFRSVTNEPGFQWDLTLGARNSGYLFHLGMIELSLGRNGDASRDLSSALALNPHFSPLDAPVATAALNRLGQQ